MNNAPHFEKCITPIEGSNNNGVEHFLRCVFNVTPPQHKGPHCMHEHEHETKEESETNTNRTTKRLRAWGEQSTNRTGLGRAEHEQDGEDTAETSTSRTAHAETNASRR